LCAINKYPVFPGQVPLDTDWLNPQRATEIAIGFALKAAFGTGTVVDGLACTPTSPASMQVVIGPGSIIYNTTVDTLTTGFGSLAVDNSTALVKIGINTAPTTMSALTAPTTAGQSQNYLIEASFSETDGGPVVLPFYNASNPAVPYSGPNNSGATSNTVRYNTVNLQIKAGAPATTGSQTTPSPDAGFVGIWVVTVPYGAASLTAGNIVQYGAAPIIQARLGPGMFSGRPQLTPFSTPGSYTWTAPVGVTSVEAYVTGGGAGGGSTTASNYGAAGGGAGGTAIGVYQVSPGTSYSVVVGSGGGAGSGGGSSSFSTFASATGGSAGAAASSVNSAGGAGGTASGGALNLNGGYGEDGQSSLTGGATSFGGAGGASYWGGGVRGGQYVTGQNVAAAQTPGSGGGGAYNLVSGSGLGGVGAPGIVVLRY
jgi:hypothetical protein